MKKSLTDKNIQAYARIRSLREDHDLTQERVGRPSAVAMGNIKNPAQAFDKVKKQGKVFLPNKEATRRFDATYQNYERLSQQMHQFEQTKQV